MQFKNNDTMVSFRIPTDVDARMDWIGERGQHRRQARFQVFGGCEVALS